MNTILWIIQALLAAIFFYSGICKSLKSEQWLITHGQTGVAGLPSWLIRLIGILEILGSAGLILPALLNIFPVLTPIAAFLFCIVMILAMQKHHRLKEPVNVSANLILFLLCAFIVYGRISFRI